MRHVFVETNWLVDCAAPMHRRNPGAYSILKSSRESELLIHIPALCVGEARRKILKAFQPRGEADAIRAYIRWATEMGSVEHQDGTAVLKTLDRYESSVRAQLAALDTTLEALRHEPGLEIFPMDDAQLALSIEISFLKNINLSYFDHGVLAAVLSRAGELRVADKDAELSFCDLDSDLWPWDKQGNRQNELGTLYTRATSGSSATIT